MIKLANPLFYPLSVLAGGVVLVVGVRFVRLPNVVILPTAALVVTVGVAFLKSREPDAEKKAKEQLQNELQMLYNSAKNLADKSRDLRQEAKQYQFPKHKSKPKSSAFGKGQINGIAQ